VAQVNDDVFFAGISELTRRLRAKEFSAVELTRAFCDRLERLGPRYNALALSLREQAIRKAKNADALLLPGVGSFQEVARILPNNEIRDMVRDGKPLFGICLGLQLFFQDSEEGQGEGLEFFKGRNVRLPSTVKVPHMGWNTLQLTKPNDILNDVPDGSYMYFVHSLYPVPTEKEIICSQTEYGTTFTSSVAEKNVYGTQFHPEKSGDNGLRILKNFARIVAR